MWTWNSLCETTKGNHLHWSKAHQYLYMDFISVYVMNIYYVQSVIPLPNLCSSVTLSFFGKITKFQLCNRYSLNCILSSVVDTRLQKASKIQSHFGIDFMKFLLKIRGRKTIIFWCDSVTDTYSIVKTGRFKKFDISIVNMIKWIFPDNIKRSQNLSTVN